MAEHSFYGDVAAVGGKPLIMRHALKKIDCRRKDAVIIGDRMDTDIIAGIESEIETVLVLSGVTAEADLKRFAYRPGHILKTVGEIAGKLAGQ